ncbi:MAG TPA: cyclodeaminase/cyclohydrolase family protein [Ktedonobacteraceae bacterium]|nr:cyclodeaminase/cyclohydrolase family protein [Ktedonobacteraceae bacterium]
MYLEQSLQNYLDELASFQPTPGGGSAAALSGAMAAALASMVVRLTQGKADYASVQQEMETLLQQTEKLRLRFQQLMQEDIEAYGRLSACFKMPRETLEEREARTKAIQSRLAEAALVPLEVAECAAELIYYCKRIAEIGNRNVLSDVATGAMLAVGAGDGASWMVRTNVRAMKDHELINTLTQRLSQALDSIATYKQQVINIVGARA